MEKKNFVFACLNLIEYYQDIYSNGVILDKIVNTCKNQDMSELCRFRVFLDSCMVTLNKEKTVDTYSSKCDFEGFFRHVNNDSKPFRFINPDNLRKVSHFFFEEDRVKKEIIVPSDSKISLYYSSKTKDLSIDDQIKIVRNAFAHSQYSSFISDANSGRLLGYSVDNATSDDPNKVESGMVISDVVHVFVLAFYSDYASIGIPYRNTFVCKYSIKDKRNLDYYNFVSVKSSNSSQHLYDGFSAEHPMKVLPLLMNDGSKLFDYIYKNMSEYEICEKPLEDIVTKEQIDSVCQKYNIPCTDTLINNPFKQDIMRLVSNTQQMVSNVLTSVSYLNDALIHYLAGESDYEELISVINEIQNEDGYSVMSNRVGFAILKSWLVAYMLEYEKKCQTAKGKTVTYYSKTGVNLDSLVDYSNVNISTFDCDQNDMQNYIRSNANKPNAAEEYIVKRYRDALMHGQLYVEVNKRNQIVIAFYDRNKRTQTDRIVKITIENLESFVDNILRDLVNRVDSKVNVI